jgi:hypothetical protein
MCEDDVVAKVVVAPLSHAVHGARPNLRTQSTPEHRAMEEKDITPVADKQRGGIGYILLWVLGVPIPILILIFLVRGCT